MTGGCVSQAARMYDAALVRLRGAAAATNFALADYRHDLVAYHKMQQARHNSACGPGSRIVGRNPQRCEL